jgi:hypothetical protein
MDFLAGEAHIGYPNTTNLLDVLKKFKSGKFHSGSFCKGAIVFETPGEKPGGSRASRFVGAALEPPGFSPGVSKTELRELDFLETTRVTLFITGLTLANSNN